MMDEKSLEILKYVLYIEDAIIEEEKQDMQEELSYT